MKFQLHPKKEPTNIPNSQPKKDPGFAEANVAEVLLSTEAFRDGPMFGFLLKINKGWSTSALCESMSLPTYCRTTTKGTS